jgi:hypothetical protein
VLYSCRLFAWFWQDCQVKSWDILKVFAIIGEQLQTVLDSLTGESEILNTEVMSPANSFAVCCETPKDISCHFADAEQGVAL